MDTLSKIVARTPAPPSRPAVVAVDGVDGCGKTTFAAHLADAYQQSGRAAFVVHEDNFLNPRSVRYQLGRDSPEGFFLDTYDLQALITKVLDPLTPGGGLRIIPATFDYRTDTPVDIESVEIPRDSVVIVEGMFLHREELADRWDFSIFLDVPFTETARRMAERDGANADPEHPSMRRYFQGQRNYLSMCSPHQRATLVVDNTEPLAPRIVEGAATRPTQTRA